MNEWAKLMRMPAFEEKNGGRKTLLKNVEASLMTDSREA
jgi:hypothetical protein